jgi:hypothetical protein
MLLCEVAALRYVARVAKSKRTALSRRRARIAQALSHTSARASLPTRGRSSAICALRLAMPEGLGGGGAGVSMGFRGVGRRRALDALGFRGRARALAASSARAPATAAETRRGGHTRQAA